MQYLVYEGPDQSGKTTTRKLVEKERDGKDVVIDRFIGTNIVLSNVNMRYTIDEMQCLYVDDSRFVNMFNPILIYLYAPVKVLLERIRNDKHEKIDSKKLIKTLSEYNKYFKRCGYKNKIKIDTSKFSQQKVVEQIINFLKYVENK
jgi:thymidylate kinase